MLDAYIEFFLKYYATVEERQTFRYQIIYREPKQQRTVETSVIKRGSKPFGLVLQARQKRLSLHIRKLFRLQTERPIKLLTGTLYREGETQDHYVTTLVCEE